MSRPTSKNFKEQDNEGKVGKKAEEWKDARIDLLAERLNRERTNTRLARDVTNDLEAKVVAHTATITQLQATLESTRTELAELKHCAAENDLQLETLRMLVEQQERDSHNLKREYNLQLDSITKALHENQRCTVSELEAQIKNQNEDLRSKDNTITKLKFANAGLEAENTQLSNTLTQLKSSLGVNNKRAQPKLKNRYYKKENLKQKSIDALFGNVSMVNLESSTSQSLHYIDNDKEDEQQVSQHKPIINNDENTAPQSNANDGTQKNKFSYKNTAQASIPQKRHLHPVSTNHPVHTNESHKRRNHYTNTNETNLPHKQNDSKVAVKIEYDPDNQTLHPNLPSEQSSANTLHSVDSSIPKSPNDFTSKKHPEQGESTQKKYTLSQLKKRNSINAINELYQSSTSTSSHNQTQISPSSFNSSKTTIADQQQRSDPPASSRKLPVSAGHRHHRAHMTGETCVACTNFYGNEPMVANVNGKPIQVTSADRIQAHSRHRHMKRATTPPGFWEMDFASPPENDRSRPHF